MTQPGGIMTAISGIDYFINFPFKMESLYLQELSNTDVQNINKNNWNNFRNNSRNNIFLWMQDLICSVKRLKK